MYKVVVFATVWRLMTGWAFPSENRVIGGPSRRSDSAIKRVTTCRSSTIHSAGTATTTDKARASLRSG